MTTTTTRDDPIAGVDADYDEAVDLVEFHFAGHRPDPPRLPAGPRRGPADRRGRRPRPGAGPAGRAGGGGGGGGPGRADRSRPGCTSARTARSP